MTSWTLTSFLSTWIARVAGSLDARIQPLFVSVFVGIFCTREKRRTATSWFRAAGIGQEFKRGYRTIGSVGRKATSIARIVLNAVENSPAACDDERLEFALDDTPSKRYGPMVEGAGLHHNPTPGPSGAKLVYGHLWVTLTRLVEHPKHGTICLPLRSELYVRRKGVPLLPKEYRWEFRTKLEQAVECIKWLKTWLGHKNKPIWLGMDGGYAKQPILQAAHENGVIVVSRLRKDAALRSLPPTKRPPGQRGRMPKYGKEKISLAKRAAHPGGWQTEEMELYGKIATKTYKTFVTTWAPASGPIRVVLVEEKHGWIPFFCTKVDATPYEILKMVSKRTTIEQTFKDVKDVWGAGEQQLRNLHANIGAWHLNLWAYTIVELWAWEQPEQDLVNRNASPWDNQPRRPSHADRRKALIRQCLLEEYRAALCGPDQHQKLQQLSLRLLDLVV